MKMNNQTQAYLIAEINQAWTHYRHLEETRSKYLSFFATVILTSAGFMVTLLKDIEKFDPGQLLLAVAIFGLFLFVFSFFIWANISRIGFVLFAYGEIMNETRKFMLGAESSASRLWDIRTRIPPTVSKGVFRIQTAATAIVLSVCLMLMCAEAYLSYLVFYGLVGAPLWQGYVIAAIALLIAILVCHVVSSLKKAQRFHVQPPEVSQIALYQIEPDISASVMRNDA